MNLRRSAPALVLALLLAPSVARAQVSDFDRNTARALGQEGHEALDRSDFATAVNRFTRADALVHAPTFLLGLAQAQAGLGHLVSALEIYNRILREGLPPRPPAAFVKALGTAQRESDALGRRIPYVIVKVAGAGAGAAKVTIDGLPVPAAALGVKRAVDPGKHAIRAESPGLAPSEVALTIAPGKTETVTLEPKPGVAPPALPPPAVVTPPPPAVVAPPPSPEPAPPAASGGSTRRVLGIAGIAIGGAGVAVGAVTGGLAIAKHGSIATSCPGGKCLMSEESTLGPEVSTYQAFAGASTAGFVVGGVLAATGVVLLVTAPKAEAARAGTGVTIEPLVGAGWAGLKGRF